MPGVNDRPNPKGDEWGKRLSDDEPQRMYRARASTTSGSGGGSSSSQGCLIALIGLCWLLTILASLLIDAGAL
ncbi:MAG: hypothetical protein ACREKH_00310 [Candidatus Rokuibacteriota bacterium]